MSDGRKALSVRIKGRVQGVGFRYWTQGEAQALGLDGWVRNEPDGSVAAFISGPEDALTAMLERLHVGPRGAAVTGVTSRPAVIGEVPAGFRITT